jgi:hypothetical protein
MDSFYDSSPVLLTRYHTLLLCFFCLLMEPRGGSHKALQSFFFLCFQARIYLQIVLLACLDGVVAFASWLILVWSLAKLAVFRV